MDEIKGWALLLLFVAVGGFIYYYLLPSSSVSETAKAVLCVFSLSAVCAPLFGVFTNIGTEIFDFEVYSTSDADEELSVYAQTARSVIEEKTDECVKKYTDVPYEIETEINISDDYSINIEYIRLIFEKDIGENYALSRELEDVFGFIPEITVKNENGQS